MCHSNAHFVMTDSPKIVKYGPSIAVCDSIYGRTRATLSPGQCNIASCVPCVISPDVVQALRTFAVNSAECPLERALNVRYISFTDTFVISASRDVHYCAY